MITLRLDYLKTWLLKELITWRLEYLKTWLLEDLITRRLEYSKIEETGARYRDYQLRKKDWHKWHKKVKNSATTLSYYFTIFYKSYANIMQFIKFIFYSFQVWFAASTCRNRTLHTCGEEVVTKIVTNTTHLWRESCGKNCRISLWFIHVSTHSNTVDDAASVFCIS